MTWINYIDQFVGLGFRGQASFVLAQLQGPTGKEQDGSDVSTEIPVTVEKPKEPEVNEPITDNHIPSYCWCLDAGHGWQTEGKRSPKLPSGYQLIEYEFNRDIVERIIEQLSALGIAYMRTMPQHGKYGNALVERVRSANSHPTDLPKIFVSVHGNAAPANSEQEFTSDSIRGIETWYHYGSKVSRSLALTFQGHLIKKLRCRDRGVKSRPTSQFYVLRATAMPTILTENLFYNNRFDLLEMRDNEVRQLIANAHVDAIVEIEKLKPF